MEWTPVPNAPGLFTKLLRTRPGGGRTALQRIDTNEGYTPPTRAHFHNVYEEIMCVKGDHIAYYGAPEDVFDEQAIRELYGIDNGYFDTLFGSIELPRPAGEPRVFVIGGCGTAITTYRRLVKADVPFATGILYTNDTDYQVARLLASEVVAAEPFGPIDDAAVARACELVDACEEVLYCGAPVREGNARLQEVIDYARAAGKLK